MSHQGQMAYAGTVSGYCEEGIRKRRTYTATYLQVASLGGNKPKMVSGAISYFNPASLIARWRPLTPSGWVDVFNVAPSPNQVFEREKSAFFQEKSRLLADPQYRGKFVAMVNGEVAGFGIDRVKLAREVYTTKGYVTMYIGEVSEEERVVDEPSYDAETA